MEKTLTEQSATVPTDNRLTSSTVTPTVTVIMPVRNEAGYIRGSLQSVLDQDYPADRVDILIADGMSTDETRAIVREYQERYANIRLVDNPGKIAPTGLNIALQQARGEIIIRVDGHCEIQPGYIHNCVRYLMDENIAGVGGPMETIGETDVAQAVALAMSSPFGVGGSAFRTVKDRKMYVDTVAFPAYKRDTIRSAGLYDEELVRNQDDEYNFRLREMGGRILLAPDVRSRYYSRSAFRSLWRQYFQYGFWKVRVMQKHPRQMSLRQFIPPVFVSSLVTLSILAPFFSAGRLLLALAAGAYAAANLAASILTAAKHGWRYLHYLIASFAILHVSYGSGFLYGLIKFASRWRVGARHG